MTNKRKNLKVNTILNMLKTCCGIMFPLLTYPYVSRILGPNNMGKINFSSSYISYFSLLAMLGMGTYSIRECSKIRDDRGRLSRLSSELYSISIVTTSISYIFLMISLLMIRQIENYKEIIIIQSFVIVLTTVGADWLNSAMEDFAYITIRTIFFQILSISMMFVFIHDREDYLIYVAITVLSSCGANIVNFFYRKKYCNTRFILHMNIKKHLPAITILFVMILAQTIFSSADITMLGLVKGDYEVGIYSMASKIERIISNIVSSTCLVLTPRMAYMFENNTYEEINKMLRKILSVFLVMGLPAFTGSFVISEELVLLVGGKEYADSTIVLKILLFSFLFSIVGGSLIGNIIMISSGKEKIYMITCCIATVENVILNLILIPYAGAVAAAFTTVISSVTITGILYWKLDKNIKIPCKRELVQAPLIGSIFIYIFCSVVKSIIKSFVVHTFICIIGSVIIYIIVLIIFKNEMICSMLDNIRMRIKNDKKR